MRSGYTFTPYSAPEESVFDRLFGVFKELIVYTSGDFDEAIDWLRNLDDEYKLTTPEYSIEDFIEDLKRKGYIREGKKDGDGGTDPGGEGAHGTPCSNRTERPECSDAWRGPLGQNPSGGVSPRRAPRPRRRP